MLKKNDVVKRADGLMIYDVRGANPNGDPDAEGGPRMLPDGRGLITDKSIKRKIRDIFVDHNAPLFKEIVEELKIDPERLHIFESATRGYDKKSPVDSAKLAKELAKSDPIAFCNKYIDVRLFGTTAISEDISFKRTGPVTMNNGESVSSILSSSSSGFTLTKKHTLEKRDLEQGNGGMAPFALKFVQHGLYYQRIAVNPHCASATFTTQEDINVLKFVLPHIFHSSASCSRPGGSINFLHIWWAEHEKTLGSFSPFKLINSLIPKSKIKNPTSLNDYDIPDSSDIWKVEDLLP